MRKMFGSIQKQKEFMRSPENLNTKTALQSQKTIEHPTNFNSFSHKSKCQQSVNKITLNASPIFIQEQIKFKLDETNSKNPRFMAKIQPQQQENIGKQYFYLTDNYQPNPIPQAIRTIRVISKPVPPNINIQIENGLNNNKRDFAKSSQKEVPIQKDQNTNDEFIHRLNQKNQKIIVKSTSGRLKIKSTNGPTIQNNQKNYFQSEQQNILLEQTVLETIKSRCFECDELIESNAFQLQCHHCYHIECLQLIIQHQLNYSQCQKAQCCGQIINMQILQQLSNQQNECSLDKQKAKTHDNMQNPQFLINLKKSSCFHCNQQIETNFTQLQCYHFYHLECIQEFIQIQVYQAKFQGVQCHCGKSISQKFITQVCDKLLPIIFARQVEIIKQNYDKYLLTCSFCQFFCIHNLERSMDSFCPNCLIRISQRQAWRKK